MLDIKPIGSADDGAEIARVRNVVEGEYGLFSGDVGKGLPLKCNCKQFRRSLKQSFYIQFFYNIQEDNIMDEKRKN